MSNQNEHVKRQKLSIFLENVSCHTYVLMFFSILSLKMYGLFLFYVIADSYK